MSEKIKCENCGEVLEHNSGLGYWCKKLDCIDYTINVREIHNRSLKVRYEDNGTKIIEMYEYDINELRQIKLEDIKDISIEFSLYQYHNSYSIINEESFDNWWNINKKRFGGK